ncbi:MAG TPA: VWA domain-containing protein, partial [Tepidisphaeraceae bacterium]|nr:VWA domain-containing protein [Tepidisphaeraceae bacterium]
MTWFPHFLSPLSAAIAAAIAIPALLILYFLKLRRREMPVSSTFLWKKAVQDLQVNAPFQRLRRNLLLFLQLLLLLMLLLALSRPVANFTPGAGKLSVILIDRSASMSAADEAGGKTRLDEAKRRAKELVSSLERNGQATIIAFDDTPEIMQTFTGDAQALRNAIDRIAPTDRKSRLKMAFQLADAQASYIPEQNRSNVKPDVRLYSDGRVLDANELLLHGDLKYEKIGTDSASNIAIVALDAKRNYELPTQVQVFARLANFGVQPKTADVQLTIDGALRSIAAVSLPPDRWNDPNWVKDHPGEKDDTFQAKDSVEFTIDLPTAGVIKVEQMSKQGDLLSADDSAQVVVPPPKSLSVALVTTENYYLDRAIQSMNLKDPVRLTPDEYEQKHPDKYDVIIFDRYYPTWTPDAGNFIYVGCAPTAANAKVKAVKENEHYVVEDDVGVLDWQRDHPILRHLNLSKVFAAHALKLTLPPDAQTLIDGTKGPMVVLSRDDRTTNLIVTFDLLDSNWPLKLSFPIFLHNALQFLALGSDMNVRPSYEPGATPKLPRAKLEEARHGLTSLALDGPTGRISVPVPPTGDFALPALNRVGLYTTDPP